jgi:hypothetical protein
VHWPGLGLAVPLDGPPDGVPLGHQHDGQRADARESGQHGDDPPGLISALPSSSYCLVTRAQSAARASISSTCHPILPGRAVRGLPLHADGEALDRNAAWYASAVGRLHAKAHPALRQAAHTEER